MATAFHKTHKEYTCNLEEAERKILRNILKDIQTLLEGGISVEQEDPLTAIVGISASAAVPTDPALARLLPVGNEEDIVEAHEYRRLTERTIREQKISNIKIILFSLEGSGPINIKLGEEKPWMIGLNDIRLVLGSRLNIESEQDAKLLHDKMFNHNQDFSLLDPLAIAYTFTTWLQESLVQAALQHNNAEASL